MGVFLRILVILDQAVEARLGALDTAGHAQEAVKLWQDAFKRAPDHSGIGMNLARVYCQAGKGDDAKAYILRVLQFNPDLGPAKKMLRDLGKSPPSCRP